MVKVCKSCGKEFQYYFPAYPRSSEKLVKYMARIANKVNIREKPKLTTVRAIMGVIDRSIRK
jgi:predicted metal-binding protein